MATVKTKSQRPTKNGKASAAVGPLSAVELDKMDAYRSFQKFCDS